MTRAARWALRSYPPSFRDHYGPELAALTEDVAPSWRHTVDLYRGSARAWLRPTFTGSDSTRCRLQASLVTVWIAWCAGFLVPPATNRALLDPPGPHVDATVQSLLDTSAVVLVVGWGFALVGAVLLVGRALVPALRARQWSALRPLLPALLLGTIEAAGLVALASAARSDTPRPTRLVVALGSGWLLGLLALLASSGIGPAVTVRRLRPDAAILRVPTLLAAGVALCLATMTATSAAAVLLSGSDASLLGAFAPVTAVVAVGVLASLTALVSSARGVRALRA